MIESVQREYDWATTNVIPAIVETVAATTDRSPTTLPPLHEATDPDALARAVADGDGCRVSLRYAARRVTVTSDGVVSVEPAERDPQ